MQRRCIGALALALVIALCGGAAADELRATGIGDTGFGRFRDGATDATAAIQAALDAAAARGAVVLLPEGQYRIDGSLSVPVGVTLRGVWQGPHTSHLDKGTVLMAYGGRGNEAGDPLIRLHTSSIAKGLTIFYPEQKPDDIVPYPWTIQGQGQHFCVIDVTIVNAFNGVDCGTHHNEGHFLRNVFMGAMNKGVFIDQCTDVGRVENVHIHNVYWWRVSAPYTPTVEQNAAMERYTLEHLEGFIIGRTDWEFISNCFVIWPKIGFHFLSGESDASGRAAGPGNILVTQSGSDIGPLAVRVDAVQRWAGVAFENCQFMSGFDVGPKNEGPVKLTNCGFWGASGSGSQMVLEGSGTVTLTATHFSEEWNQPKDQPRVKALNGSLLMQNCDFASRRQNAPDVYLGPEIGSAVIMGNRFAGREEPILNEASKKNRVQILGNVVEYTKTVDVVVWDFETPTDYDLGGHFSSGEEGKVALTHTDARAHAGQRSAQLDYTFTSSGTGASGNDFIEIVWPDPIELDGKPYGIGVWAFGNGEEHSVKMVLTDSTGEAFHVSLGSVDTERWRFLRSVIAAGITWFGGGGNDDRVLDAPLNIRGILFDDVPDTFVGSGTVYLDDLTVLFEAEDE